jgi:hypothetical protein
MVVASELKLIFSSSSELKLSVFTISGIHACMIVTSGLQLKVSSYMWVPFK